MGHKITNEIDFSQWMDSIDSRLEDLSRRRGLAHYHMLLGEKHEDLNQLNTEYSNIMIQPENQTILDEWISKCSSPKTVRRADLFKRAFLGAAIESHPELFELTMMLEKQIVEFKPEMDGKAISRSDQRKILESEPDRSLREKAYFAERVLGDRIRDDLIRLTQMRNRVAVELGYHDFVQLGYDLQDLKREELTQLFQQIKDLTQNVWDQVLDQIKKCLNVTQVKPWDISYYLHSKLPVPHSSHFPKSNIIAAFDSVFKKAGGCLKDLPIQVIERDIPYGGLCMGIEYGKDVRILVNPMDGLSWYDILFHELGHGIHSCLVDTSSFVVAGGDPPFFWEGIAGIFERLVYEPGFLKDQFNLSDQEIESVREQSKMHRIIWFRNIAVATQLEWAIYDGENPETAQEKLIREYLGIEPVTGGWASNTLYTTHPLYNQNYLLMEVMALHTIRYYRDRFGSFPTADLFDFVKDNYAGPAAWISWRDKIKTTTGKALDAEALCAFLTGK